MKRILLAVCGLTPQVITETLYALIQQGKMVNGIHIITTRQGREVCLGHLLAPEIGQYHHLLADYGIDSDKIDFNSRNILAATDDFGREIDDIGSEEENEHFLSACMKKTFALTQDKDTAVYFSIAGGRKTMGACLALAAQIYARPCDRIFHVLVSPEFESSHAFFFPPARSVPITLHDKTGQPYIKETRYATITLVSMPFFQLRSRITDEIFKKPESPATLMLSMNRTIRPELIINLKACTITWKEFQIDLPPAQLTLYAFFGLLKKQSSCKNVTCRGCRSCTLDYGEIVERQPEITEIYQRITVTGPANALSDSGITSLSKENFNSYRSKINKSIKKRFGTQDHHRLLIASQKASCR